MKSFARMQMGGKLVFVTPLLVVIILTPPAWGQETTQPTAADAAAPAEVENPDAIEMTRPGVFTVNFHDTDLKLALRLLSTQGRRNIVPTKGVDGTVTASLYEVTFQEALEAVLRSTGYVYEEKGNFIYIYTPERLEEVRQAERELTEQVFRVTYITASDAKTFLTPVLSEVGTITVTPSSAVGIPQSATDTGGNAYASGDLLVVRDYEDRLRRIEEVLREMDVRPEQVLVEATLLRATLTEDNALGVDFNAVSGVDFQAINATSAGLSNLVPGALTTPELPNNSSSLWRTDFNAAIPQGGMSIGFLKNDIGFFIRALEGVTDVSVLANPKLLVINKQRGEILIGSRDGYLTTTVTETTATQTVEFLETGTQLIMRPFIGKDGFIRMEIHPKDSSGTVAQVGGNVLPSETTTEATSNVMVRDGHTIVIGGLFRERTSNDRSQVPWFGNLPYVGTAFRRSSDTTEREEVVILITPRIVQQDVDEGVSHALKDDVERFRAGQRKGLQWWSRSRLAQTHMRWARQAAREGRKDLALWNTEMALSMSPRMVEAIRLHEQLTDQAYWSSESQHSAAKYVIQRMIMREMGKSTRTVTPPDKPLDVERLDPEVRKAMGAIPSPQPDVVDLPADDRDVQPIPHPTPAPGPEPQRGTPSAQPDPADAGGDSGRGESTS